MLFSLFYPLSLLLLRSVLLDYLRGCTDIQQCHGHRCRTKSAAASVAVPTSEVPSATDDTTAPAESSSSEDDGESTSSPTTAITTGDVSASTSAKPAGTSAAPPASGGGGDHWKPSMSDTFVVDLENTPIPSNAASVYVVDLAHSADQMYVILIFHISSDADQIVQLTKVNPVTNRSRLELTFLADGKHVACYFSAGARDPYRSVSHLSNKTKPISYRDDKLLFKPECYCGPGETGRDETTGVCTSTENK